MIEKIIALWRRLFGINLDPRHVERTLESIQKHNSMRPNRLRTTKDLFKGGKPQTKPPKSLKSQLWRK